MIAQSPQVAKQAAPPRIRGPLVMAALVAVFVAALGAPPTVAGASPTSGPTFNDPTDIRYSQMAIARKLMAAVDGVPAGGTIRMTFYGLSLEELADKLIDAHERGVNVKLLMDDHLVGTTWPRLATALGSDPTSRSFAILCHRGCFTDQDPSYLHSKFYMFSSSGSSRLVVMLSSANPTYSQARRGWNDAYTMVGDPTLYSAFRSYFDDLTAGAMQPVQSEEAPDYYRTVSSGKYKVYFFPKGGEGRFDDPVYSMLRNIRCTGAARGYGSDGRTVIKITMYQWSRGRLRLAEKLWRLDDEGCDVEILYAQTQTDLEVLGALKRPGGRNGGPKLWPTSIDVTRDGLIDHYTHNKYFLVNGVYAGDSSSRIVFMGSANWTNTALRYNDEVMLKISDEKTHGLYLKHFVKVRTWVKEVLADGAIAPPRVVPAGLWWTNERLGPDAD